MGILLSFLNLLLYIAIILFIAYVLLWVVRDWFGWTVDANVMKFGTIIVGLICLIAIVVWLSSVLGGGPGLPNPFRSEFPGGAFAAISASPARYLSRLLIFTQGDA